MDYQSLKSLFVQSAWWGGYETIIFNTLLTIHTTALFVVMSSDMYGVIGVCLSLVYLITSCATMGNDVTTAFILGPIPSRYSILCTVFSHMMHAALVLVIACFIVFSWYSSLLNLYNELIFVAFLLICAEIGRKIVKSTLLATRHFKLVAHIEIASIVIYMTFIWTAWYLIGTLSPLIIIFSLFYCSLATDLAFILLLHRLYLRTTAPQSSCSLYTVVGMKLRTMLGGVVYLLFSGNCIVPIVASFGGSVSAGGMKLTTTIIQYIVTVTDRIFSATSSLLFVQAQDTDNTKKALLMLYRTMIPFLVVSSFCICVLLYILMIYKQLTHLLPVISAYFIMQLCGILAGVFERLLLTRQYFQLAHIHIATLCVFSGIAYTGNCIGCTAILIALASVRLFFLVIVGSVSAYYIFGVSILSMISQKKRTSQSTETNELLQRHTIDQ